MEPSRQREGGISLSVFKEIEIVLHFCNDFVNDRRDGKNCVQHYKYHGNKSRQTSRYILVLWMPHKFLMTTLMKEKLKQNKINTSSSVNYMYSIDARKFTALRFNRPLVEFLGVPSWKSCFRRYVLLKTPLYIQVIFVALTLHKVSNRFETPAISRPQNRAEIASGLEARSVRDKNCIELGKKICLCKSSSSFQSFCMIFLSRKIPSFYIFLKLSQLAFSTHHLLVSLSLIKKKHSCIIRNALGYKST